MWITFNCYHCKLPFEVRDFLPSAMTVKCVTCGTNNSIAQGIGNMYGKRAGELAQRVMSTVEVYAKRGDEFPKALMMLEEIVARAKADDRCSYCGNDAHTSEQHEKERSRFRKLEDWESGALQARILDGLSMAFIGEQTQ